ncbi:hypothetical protein HCH_04886 [Hahella chejuensis KCTC 2396]|uniref:Uncharacterized protein n=1 Tax=Hahella chejuensis (strain KCTC 2396) TaxID=349521 RepID=Q2SCP7_HAHCH|nr:hypothetical protein HCH_04886 [Hahella chejuensis KCTC 2396]
MLLFGPAPDVQDGVGRFIGDSGRSGGAAHRYPPVLWKL